MSDALQPSAPSPERASQHRFRLFVISILALVTAGISFSLRSAIAPVLSDCYLAPLDPARANQMLGEILGISFLGFAFTIAIGSALLDWLGMRLLLMLSSLCFITGTMIVVFVDRLSASLPVYWVLWSGMLLTGIAWGLVECVINPLVASLYTEDKTSKLNVLHAWWPFGLIIGGLIGLAVSGHTLIDASWKLPFLATVVTAVLFGCLVATTAFPVTERVASGVSTAGMFAELRRPMFVVWFLCMFCTAACELAPGQWVNVALSQQVHMKGVLLTVYIAALMYVMRHFAGHPARRLSPVGLLWFSSLFAGLGLFTLSIATSPASALIASTIWGIGVCYMWPTMLATASERFPRGGALLMGLMGTAGTLSIWFFLPKMGAISDQVMSNLVSGHDPGSPFHLLISAIGNVIHAMAATIGLATPAAPDAATNQALQALQQSALHDPHAQARLEQFQNMSLSSSIKAMAIIPAVLLVVFGLIWYRDHQRGGYRPTRL